MKDLIPVTFQFRGQYGRMETDAITVCRMNSPFYPGEKWAVRRLSSCLAKDGEWEFEPSPSNRNHDFYERCRFDTIEEAEKAAKESGGL